MTVQTSRCRLFSPAFRAADRLAGHFPASQTVRSLPRFPSPHVGQSLASGRELQVEVRSLSRRSPAIATAGVVPLKLRRRPASTAMPCEAALQAAATHRPGGATPGRGARPAIVGGMTSEGAIPETEANQRHGIGRNRQERRGPGGIGRKQGEGERQGKVRFVRRACKEIQGPSDVRFTPDGLLYFTSLCCDIRRDMGYRH